MLLVMSLHPTGHALMVPERFARLARLNMMIHALAVATVPVLFLGLLGPRRLGSSDLTTAAGRVRPPSRDPGPARRHGALPTSWP